jgi:hypothetical protein
MVAVTLMAAVTACAVLRAGDADAAATVVAAGASPARATVIRDTARWVSFMMSCFLAGRAGGCLRFPGRRAGHARPAALPGVAAAWPG